MRKKGEGTLGALTIYTIHPGGNFSCKYSEDVLLSIGKFKRKRKNAAIKPIVCIISFSNQNFRVFRVNGI